MSTSVCAHKLPMAPGVDFCSRGLAFVVHDVTGFLQDYRNFRRSRN